ncbi:hypothetical protein GCM10022221_31320 [Actinocorallia aurea]
MPHNLDEIDWTAYEGAYGDASEVHDILTALASDDIDQVDEGLDGFFSSVWHQGTVYSATVVAVPHVVALAADPRAHRRPVLLRVLGMLCDPAQSDGAHQPAVAAAVARHGAELAALLDDPDTEVREQAAYAAAWCGPGTRDALLHRWAAEPDPAVRASLLLGLALHGPGAPADLLRAAFDGPFPLPLAAALAVQRSGSGLAREHTTAVAAALAADTPWENPWSEDPVSELLEGIDPDTAEHLTGLMATGPAAGRVNAAHGMGDRFRHSRSAPAALLPRLRALLEDPDPAVVSAAVHAAAHAGPPAAGVADVLARIAAQGESRESDIALGILIRLDDPRWQAPVLAAWSAGTDPGPARLLTDHVPAATPELIDAARRRLAEQLAEGLDGNPVITLVGLLGAWGAAEAVPDIASALNAAPWAAAAALGAFGPAAHAAVPALRRAAEEQPEAAVRMAHAIWRITGDTGPLVTAGVSLAARARVSWELELLADAEGDAAPLVPALSRHLTGAAAPIFPDRDDQIAAARVVWRVGGDLGPVLTTVEAVLRSGDVPARSAARLACDLAPDHGADLVPALRDALDDPWARVQAARALWRHGAHPADLTEPLLAALADPRGGGDPIAALVEMRATDAVPALRALADSDARLPATGFHDETVWQDDRTRAHLHAAITTLT